MKFKTKILFLVAVLCISSFVFANYGIIHTPSKYKCSDWTSLPEKTFYELIEQSFGITCKGYADCSSLESKARNEMIIEHKDGKRRICLPEEWEQHWEGN